MSHYLLAPANFEDYRDFLRARFDEIRERNKNYSLAVCSRQAKISKSLLQFVFKKQRHLSLDKMPALAKALKLTSEEEYFTYLLICKNAGQNPEIQNHFEKILSRIRHENVRVDVVSPEVSLTNKKELYLDSLFMILQTLVNLKGFREDDKWIADTLVAPEINAEKVNEAMKELLKHGFISRDESGRLKSGDTALWRPDPYDPKGQDVFKRGAEALSLLMKNCEIYRPSVYMSMSLGMDETNLLKAEKLMIELHHRLCELSRESKEPTAVAFFGNYFLTVARLKS